jgi:hypothetical protein
VHVNYVNVDALQCGSITRFMCHFCYPNAAFVEQQTRARIKVRVKMTNTVSFEVQIVVYYDNERWFQCACVRCWNHRSEDVGDSAEEYAAEVFDFLALNACNHSRS